MLRFSSHLLASNERAFMDIAIGQRAPRRIVFELFMKKCPVAAENFLKLCTEANVLPRQSSIEGLGEPGFAEQFLPQLTYRNSIIHRIHKGYIIQGGDIVSDKGVSQLSIYGETFSAPEETAASVFAARGLLGTAVSAPHLNGSQFFILTRDKATHLNGTCICFGRVISDWDVVQEIESVPLAPSQLPEERITIVNCGQM